MDSPLPLLTVDSPLFPGLMTTTEIDDSRNAALVAHLAGLPAEERLCGALAVRDGYELGERAFRSLYGVGCTSVVTLSADGSTATLTGQARFRVVEMGEHASHADSYLTAAVSGLPERTGDDPLGAATMAIARFRRYAEAVSEIADPGLHIESLPDDPTALSYLISAALRLLPPQRQRLLESPDTTSRLAELIGIIDDELVAMSVLPSLPDTDIEWSTMAPN